MQQLPRLYSEDVTLSLLISKWSTILNPVLQNPATNSIILNNISLANGTTVINHLLGRMMQGWSLVDINGAATVYRSQPFNDKTLTLVSNAAVTVNLEVF